MSRKAWIIGASSGIGAAVADELQSKGWQVVRSSRSKGDLLIDIADDLSVEKAASEYQEKYGEFDLVLVMAGFWQRMSVQKFDLDVFKQHNNTLESIRADLVGSKVLIQTVSPGFVKTPMTDVNEFKMPFIISAEQAAKTIVKGIEKRKTEIIFPLPMAITMKLARLVPLSIWPKLFKKG
ncbi:MAG: SDR family NAD(P)-dependent oxidoreductase [Actinobacteria bacterium]|nr:SDR family NAD(P)-dependent oxidoreductase [Actinomycetota bacterium]